MALVRTAHGRTLREQHKQMTHDWIRELMIGLAANPITLLEVVARGPLEFRDRVLREGKGLALNGDIADSIFRFLCNKVIDRFGPDADAAALLDSELVASMADARPPTEAEIEAAWEFGPSHSSEEGKRFFYKDVVGPTIHVTTTPVVPTPPARLLDPSGQRIHRVH